MTRKDAPISRPVLLAATVVVLAAAVSAGIHAGLVPEHLEEMPLLGVSFILAVLSLIAVGVAVGSHPRSQLPASLAALLFGALTLAYVASRTTGLPFLEPDPEVVDSIGIVTVAVQVTGAAAALWLTREASRQRSVPAETPDTGVSGASPGYRIGTLSLAGLTAILFTVLALNGVGFGESHEHGDNEGHHHDTPALMEGMQHMD